VNDPVMGTAESIIIKDMIGVGHKVTIGKEQQFNQRDDLVWRFMCCWRLVRSDSGFTRGIQIYVSHIDIFYRR